MKDNIFQAEFFRMLQCASEDAQAMMKAEWPECATLLCRAREALHVAVCLAINELGVNKFGNVNEYVVWSTQCRLELEQMAKNHDLARHIVARSEARAANEFLHELIEDQYATSADTLRIVFDAGRASMQLEAGSVKEYRHDIVSQAHFNLFDTGPKFKGAA